MKLSWRIKASFFKLIRPLFVKDLDVYEDFECEACGNPVLKRYFYCSKECSDIEDTSKTSQEFHDRCKEIRKRKGNL